MVSVPGALRRTAMQTQQDGPHVYLQFFSWIKKDFESRASTEQAFPPAAGAFYS